MYRDRFLALRRNFGQTERSNADNAICQNIRQWEIYRDADQVALYATDGEEPDLSSLFGDAEKRFYFPRYVAKEHDYELIEVCDLKRDLVRAKFGLLEPRSELPATAVGLGEKMLFLTPAVACDRHGVRLGRGGGFYDRMLNRGAMAVAAIVYDCQLTENLPREAHDRKVDFAVTEKGILKF
ncbi:MAG: 5-formyltetrahydrofolate cyclo-ligase [Victivallales bacterium]|jgi:5-formyltetrahydrofolate cyclo-ligase|nr:5-formyltetrahydrofolate cyclo-ligase [Victivallales bacterium]